MEWDIVSNAELRSSTMRMDIRQKSAAIRRSFVLFFCIVGRSQTRTVHWGRYWRGNNEFGLHRFERKGKLVMGGRLLKLFGSKSDFLRIGITAADWNITGV
ncbi:hypothetical protein XENOCAPTIV_020465 [Xenoophorus captivus]|uniref:Uncharacterized protein n=1 Tax=Xenoophorus captivus TaxID=1517983 RepID=A0ABV0QAU7_9TELE